MLTNQTLSKMSIDKIIDDFENLYYPLRQKLTEIKRDSKLDEVGKCHKALKLTRHWFRTGGKIA